MMFLDLAALETAQLTPVTTGVVDSMISNKATVTDSVILTKATPSVYHLVIAMTRKAMMMVTRRNRRTM